MKPCPVCGGATQCPADDNITTVLLRDVRQIPTEDPIPPGMVVTHRRKAYYIAIPATATVVGTAQSDRVLAHNPHLRRVWVGPCAYAFTDDVDA